MVNIVSVSYIDLLPELSIKCNSGAASAFAEARGTDVWQIFYDEL